MLLAKPFILAYAHTSSDPNQSDLEEKENESQIPDVTHPEYDSMISSWRKWRITFEGGDDYIEHFVMKHSNLEDNTEFANRKTITPLPAFAKSAVIDVKNAIFQRLVDVTRNGGPKTYQDVVNGSNGGVDLLGNSMDSFVGREVLPELLAIGKVGVYVDMPLLPENLSLMERAKSGIRPYIYSYRAEDIRSWSYLNINERSELSQILLRDHAFAKDPETGLPVLEVERFRLLSLVDEKQEDGSSKRKVAVQFYNDDGAKVTPDGFVKENSLVILDIPRIPFVILEISDSLLADIANHQIALTNLASSDISYALKANYPFYTEQFDPRIESSHLRGPAARQPAPAEDEKQKGGEATRAPLAAAPQLELGVKGGRRYPLKTERPQFIHPSAEPLRASIEKQEQLKTEIRQLINLNISNLHPVRESAEGKAFGERGLEAGLSYIGLELEYGERRFITFWSMYESDDAEFAIKYPETYSLRSIDDRRKEAQDLEKIKEAVPSDTFRKKISKEQAFITLGPKSTLAEMEKINNEIDAAKWSTSDPDKIKIDVELGILDLETAATARGYDKSLVKKAQDEHAERLKRVSAAQTAPGGVDPGDPDASDLEKQGKDKRGEEDKWPHNIQQPRTQLILRTLVMMVRLMILRHRLLTITTLTKK